MNGRIISSFHKFCINRIKKNFNLRGDSYAIVTGATSGIGREYCNILKKAGFNLIILGRNNDKLQKVANELDNSVCSGSNYTDTTNPPNQVKTTKTILFDFKNIEEYKNKENELIKFFSEHNISLLVNNVGMSKVTQNFEDDSLNNTIDSLNVNILSHVFITKVVLNARKNRVKQNNNVSKLGIINISSVYGLNPTPCVSLYSASKAFFSAFSRCIAFENENQRENISVLCVHPFWVRSNMVKYKRSFSVLEPHEMIYSTLWKLSLFNNTYGNWRHSIIGILLRFIPKKMYAREQFKYYSEYINKIKNIMSKRNINNKE